MKKLLFWASLEILWAINPNEIIVRTLRRGSLLPGSGILKYPISRNYYCRDNYYERPQAEYLQPKMCGIQSGDFLENKAYFGSRYLRFFLKEKVFYNPKTQIPDLPVCSGGETDPGRLWRSNWIQPKFRNLSTNFDPTFSGGDDIYPTEILPQWEHHLVPNSRVVNQTIYGHKMQFIFHKKSNHLVGQAGYIDHYITSWPEHHREKDWSQFYTMDEFEDQPFCSYSGLSKSVNLVYECILPEKTAGKYVIFTVLRDTLEEMCFRSFCCMTKGSPLWLETLIRV